jgi:nucleoside-diphosphate-sugar epimerase
MKILVTGVSGFVGGRLALRLSEKHKVWGVYRRTYPLHLKGVANLKLIQDDLSQPGNLPTSCDYLVHAAADSPSTTKDKAQLWSSNLDGMKQLLKWASKVGVGQILFCSTMDVYGQIEETWIDEKTPSRNPNVYGASKKAAEECLKNWAERQSSCACLTIRLPGVVGREARFTFLHHTIQKIMDLEPITVFSKDALFNNVVHVEDLAFYAMALTEQSNQPVYNCFNAATIEPISLEKMAKTLMSGLEQDVPIHENRQGRPPFLIKTDRAHKYNFPLDTTHSCLLRFAAEMLG